MFDIGWIPLCLFTCCYTIAMQRCGTSHNARNVIHNQSDKELAIYKSQFRNDDNLEGSVCVLELIALIINQCQPPFITRVYWHFDSLLPRSFYINSNHFLKFAKNSKLKYKGKETASTNQCQEIVPYLILRFYVYKCV